MRQVPHYLIIGNGRIAHHFSYYFSLLSISFHAWHRNESISKLKDQIKTSTHILLMINDSAIETFIKENLMDVNALLIHFSGSLSTHLAFGAHPLMTFNQDLYSLEAYQAIPFIIDEDAPSFEELLPHLPNQHVRIAKELKPKYHALCVLSGNFSCMLWQKMLTTLEKEFNMPHQIAFPYFSQQLQNLFKDHKNALTGPLIRGDVKTIEKNLEALTADPFQDVYKSFVSCHQKIKDEVLI